MTVEAEDLLSPAPPMDPPPAANAGAVSTGSEGIAMALGVGPSTGTTDVAPAVANYLSQHQDLMQVQKDNLQRHARVLDAHESYLRLQMENLHEQRHLTVSHMKWQHLNDVLRGTLQVLLVIVGLGIVIGLGAMVWNARHDTGLVVEAFSVPPELEERGYTGSVIAQKALDRIAVLQDLAISLRAPQPYEVTWGTDFTVEIPETGISFGEFNRYLRQWLGKETRISGEVVRTETGIAIHARAGANPVESVSGSFAELETMVDRIAEQVLAATQPHQYAGSLAGLGRFDEAIAAYQQLSRSNAPVERAAAYAGMSRLRLLRGENDAAYAAAQLAVQANPEILEAWVQLMYLDTGQGRNESALRRAERLYTLAASSRDADQRIREWAEDRGACWAREARGDMGVCVRRTLSQQANQWEQVSRLALGHDIAGARQVISEVTTEPVVSAFRDGPTRQKPKALGDIALAEENFSVAEKAFEEGLSEAPVYLQLFSAWHAYAHAMQGDVSGAEQLITNTPADCYPCLRVRGKIASLKKAWPEAERWFVEAAKQGPSLPFANTDHAEMLLAKGDAHGAVEQAREAIKRGPKFADAYQVLGEVLAQSGDHAGAIKQFEQAAKYAPKWGRTQIQWGMASTNWDVVTKRWKNSPQPKHSNSRQAKELCCSNPVAGRECQMADDTNSSGISTPSPDSSATTPPAGDGIATMLAIEQENTEGKSSPVVSAFLEKQSAFIDRQQRMLGVQEEYLRLQMEDLHEQRKLTVSHMKWQHLTDALRGVLYIALAFVGVGIAVAGAAAVWNAAHYRGVVMEAFAVPPDLMKRGYSGTVVSQKILDRISELQSDANLLSIVAMSTLESDWGDELRVEIPETGVSLGEVGRYLRRHLGSETRISGEVVRTVDGLMISARINGRPANPVTGNEIDIDALIARAGEQVMSAGLPHHYAAALANVGREDEAIAVIQPLARSATTVMERSAAYITWSFRLLDRGDYAEAEAKARAGMRLAPEAVGNAQYRLWDVDYSLGRFEKAHSDANAATTNFRTMPSDFYSPNALARLVSSITCEQFLLTGSLQQALQACREGVVAASTQGALSPLPWGPPYLLALEHNIAAAQEEEAVIEDPPDPGSPSPVSVRFRRRAEAMGSLRLAREDWDGAISAYRRGINVAPSRALVLKPWLAYALAKKGDLAGANAVMQELPDDCYPCLRARGKIAASQHDWQTAERWFAEAARQGPSLAWANTDWAEMLIAKGDAQGAITQAREAIKRGPKFADAYQALGEALAQSGNHADAIAEYKRAAELAPKWGRIHIQWAMSLNKLGRRAEAQQKFKTAEALELVPSEQKLLAAIR